MSQRSSDDILFSLCFLQLTNMMEGFKRRRPFYPSKAEVTAQLKIINCLYELASGAAVRNDLEKQYTAPLVTLVDELTDLLEWNTNNQK